MGLVVLVVQLTLWVLVALGDQKLLYCLWFQQVLVVPVGLVVQLLQ